MRAAIIGIGAIARMHARALRDIPGVELVAASCRTEEKGRAFAAEFGCTWHADTRRMLRRERLDFVTVATPSGGHLEAVTAAARRGVHVITNFHRHGSQPAIRPLSNDFCMSPRPMPIRAAPKLPTADRACSRPSA